MGVWNAMGSSKDYFSTLPRGFISLSTGKPYTPPLDGRVGGEPHRFETDAEYEARQAEYDASRAGNEKQAVYQSADIHNTYGRYLGQFDKRGGE